MSTETKNEFALGVLTQLASKEIEYSSGLALDILILIEDGFEISNCNALQQKELEYIIANKKAMRDNFEMLFDYYYDTMYQE